MSECACAEESSDLLFVRLEMWLEENEGEITGVRYNYSLPKINDELTVELYKVLIETLCAEISTLEGAEKLVGMGIELDSKDGVEDERLGA